MMHISTLISNAPCELINIVPQNPLISKCQIKVCYVGDTPNRNGSIITKETARQIANSLPGSPIVGFYNEASGDFEEHNRRIDISGGVLKFEDTTRPYGFVDLNAKVWFQDYLDDGIVHTYLVTEGWLWTGRYREVQRVIDCGNNQSMEFDEDSLNGSWTKDYNGELEFFIVNDAVISALCILGEKFEPCFEGSSITHFSLDDNFNQRIYNLMKEVRKLKGGNSLMNNEETVTTVEEVVAPQENIEEEKEVVTEFAAESVEENSSAEAQESTEEVKEEESAEEESVNEENKNSEDEVVSFSLDDFQSLQRNYSELENQFNELTTQYNEMKANYDTLVAFKQSKEREDKQRMIDSFTMLSDVDKKEVQDNIDNYSLEEIESKLSVICVHNKLDLSEKKETEDVEITETTFSLNENIEKEDFGAPAWVSLLRRQKNEN